MPSQSCNVGAIVRNLIGFGAIAVIFYFLGRSLVSNWSDLTAEDIDVQPALLVVSTLPVAASIILVAFIWRQIVAYLAGPDQTNLGQLPKVFLYSWAGRYVPGKVAYVAGRFFLGRSAASTRIVAPISAKRSEANRRLSMRVCLAVRAASGGGRPERELIRLTPRARA